MPRHPDVRRFEFARLIFEGKTIQQAADELGVNFETCKDWNTREDVIAETERLRAEFVAAHPQEFQLSKEIMLEKLAALANLAANRENATAITRAIETALKVLEFFSPRKGAPLDPQDPAQPEVYRSAWLNQNPSDRPQ